MATGVYESEETVYHMQLRRGCFLNHGCTEPCPEYQMALAGTSNRGHSDACMSVLGDAIISPLAGLDNISLQQGTENEKLA